MVTRRLATVLIIIVVVAVIGGLALAWALHKHARHGTPPLSRSLVFPSRSKALLAPIAYNMSSGSFKYDEIGYFGLDCDINALVYNDTGPLASLTSPSGVFNQGILSADVGCVKLQAPKLNSPGSVTGWLRTAKWLLSNEVAVELLLTFQGSPGGGSIVDSVDIPDALKLLERLQSEVPALQKPHIGLCMDFERVQSASDWADVRRLLPPPRRHKGPFVLSIFVEKSGSFLSTGLLGALDYVSVMFYANADNADRFVSDASARTILSNGNPVSFAEATRSTQTPVQVCVETTWMATPSASTCSWVSKSTFVGYTGKIPPTAQNTTALGRALSAVDVWESPPAASGIVPFAVEALRAWTQLERNVKNRPGDFPASQEAVKAFCASGSALTRTCRSVTVDNT